MRIAFVTTNKHKFQEVSKVLADFGIGTEWINEKYPEPEGDIHYVATETAKMVAARLGKPVIVEDTGIFFEAFNNFPGPHPKFVVEGIGLDGILTLLKGRSRKAYSHCVAAYCEPGKEPVLFDAKMSVTIAEEIVVPDNDAMPYDHLFIPEGQDKAIAEMTVEEKNSFSHRAEAFRELGKYLKAKNE